MRSNGTETLSEIRMLGADQFVQISVRNARTHLDDGKAQFTDFEVELKTNHIAFTLKNSKVRRRYSDFVWLRNRLAKDTINSAHPPSLPGRRLFGRFNKDFIKQRQKKLQEFLFGLVENNVYLSHAAVHLFLQSKLLVEEIDTYLDGPREEDASETILAESEGKARIGGYVVGVDDGCRLPEDGVENNLTTEELLLNNDIDNNNCTTANTSLADDRSRFSDGNNADDESEIPDIEDMVDEGDPDFERHGRSSDEEEIVEELNKLRMSLPAEPSFDNDQFGSSVDFSNGSSEDNHNSSDNSHNQNSDERDSSTENHNDDTDNSNTWASSSQRINSQENVRGGNGWYSRRSKPRCFSRNNSMRRLYTSNASLPEFYKSSQTDVRGDTETAAERAKTLRRSKSFYEYRAQKRNSAAIRRKSVTHLEKQSSFNRNEICTTPKARRHRSQISLQGTPRRVKRTTSLASSMDKGTPHKRKISLNEYIIVGRESLLESKSSGTENFGKSSL